MPWILCRPLVYVGRAPAPPLVKKHLSEVIYLLYPGALYEKQQEGGFFTLVFTVLAFPQRNTAWIIYQSTFTVYLIH